MSLFGRKSLSEDSLDRYSHTWAFAFLLLMSMVTLFLPLSPSMTVRQPRPLQWPGESVETPGGRPKSNKSVTAAYPVYQADCWVPPQFTGAHVLYANKVCAAAVNALGRGENSTAASIYNFETYLNHASEEEIRPVERSSISATNGNVEPDTNTNTAADKAITEEFRSKSDLLQHERDTLFFGIQDLVSYTTPLYLFLLALFLRLPKALWSLLSTCCGSINVDKTLAMVQAVQSADAPAGNKLERNIALSFGKSPGKATGTLYLLMKLLMVIVLVVEIIALSSVLLEETNKLQKCINKVKIMEENAMKLYKPREDNKDRRKEMASSLKPGFVDYNKFYACQFQIKQIQNLQTFLVQCLFTLTADEGGIDTNTEDETKNGRFDFKSRGGPAEVVPESTSMSESNIVALYKTLFTVIVAKLVILVGINMVSFMTWIAILVMPFSKTQYGLNSAASLDLVFLVAMARRNTSVTVAMVIAESALTPSKARYQKGDDTVQLEGNME